MKIKIFTLIIFLFAVLGCAFMNSIIHEYIHYLDFSSVNNNFESQEICVMELPTNITFKNIMSLAGYYKFSYPTYNETLLKEIEKIDKYAEYKAYFVSIVFSLLFLFIYFKSIFENQNDWKRNI